VTESQLPHPLGVEERTRPMTDRETSFAALVEGKEPLLRAAMIVRYGPDRGGGQPASFPGWVVPRATLRLPVREGFVDWTEALIAVGVAGGAYLIGSFPSAYLIGKAVWALDVGKGAAVAIPLENGPIWRLAVAVVFLILGHAYPVWLGFVGGKGLAAAGGFTAALMPLAALMAGAACGLVWLVTRRFLPTVVTVVALTFVLARFTGVRWGIMAVALGGFLLTAVKRVIDEPRMRRIEAETGWNRTTGGSE